MARLSLLGLQLITPSIFHDERGFFFESYRGPRYAGIDLSFVQDNLSFSRKHTIRGLHFQLGQAKLVTCLEGRIWDVAVDIDPDSPTYGQWNGVELDGKTFQQLYIPSGFAHGFCVLSESALVQYKVSSLYDPKAEKAIRWNDPKLAISWPVQEPILSPRDRKSPFFEEVFS